MHDNRIESKSILVVGDIMLDTYYTGDVRRISPEAPVPVFRKKAERCALGGAANVAANLVAAGQRVSIMSIIGNDNTGEKLRSIFESQGINTDLIIALKRHTTEKTRFLASNNQQVFRLDVEDTDPLSENDCRSFLDVLEKTITDYDLILLSDYLKGLFTFDFTQGAIKIAREKNIPVIIDVKDLKYEKYNQATLIKPNLKELHVLTGKEVGTDEEIVSASRELKDACKCDYVLTTCGGRGMVLVGDGEPYFIEAFGQEVYDVTGAGDTTIAYLGACMANGYSVRESVDIANLAAGIQVSKVGTSSVYWPEIRKRMEEQTDGTIHKIINDQMVHSFRKDHADKKIVFTNGCFDILHIGHIRYLQEAAKLGDLLIVGLNSDESVRRLKGSERPINNEKDRAEMLGSLRFVDYVAVFSDDTPLELINVIQPDVLVKGGDYKPEDVVGREEVLARGGRLAIIPFIEGQSTTEIIEKIKH